MYFSRVSSRLGPNYGYNIDYRTRSNIQIQFSITYFIFYNIYCWQHPTLGAWAVSRLTILPPPSIRYLPSVSADDRNRSTCRYVVLSFGISEDVSRNRRKNSHNFRNGLQIIINFFEMYTMSNTNSKREDANQARRINVRCYSEQTTYIFSQPLATKSFFFPPLSFKQWVRLRQRL